MQDDFTNCRPPLGLIPEPLWIEERVGAILAAMHRYHAAGARIPVEWTAELHTHCMRGYLPPRPHSENRSPMAPAS